ncbi:MAG: ABC transporter substrate-binding protein [Chiayiivirga sp.]|jgi:phospholipid transport system substrate-binding protein|uniref:MlaC/ttg2D family ABC transporter substrate-binding protein n=1 Tax=Chiayiivirga sp. TaxID=2041042 RepID=UPI0025BDA696|nr:ABC transporter substrate-binding protein [Chiayiivirga sp.]MCI1711206.1 ABC transporter substrate-binding protein [Chiayiivirga sp.]MCI1727992.1 ABC transporter substrate-binding protein [Chiayiivirga sp.]
MTLRACFLAALVGLAATLPAFAATASPGEIVKARTRSVLGTLVEQRAAFQADPAKLNAFVKAELEQVMDREYSARLVLGRHGRAASQAQIDAFAAALTDNLLRRYGTAMLDFDPDVDVRVKSETPLQNGKLVRVASEVLRKGGAPVPVDYLFRPDASGAWKMFDVIVEGVSYVQTYRTQFDEQLRSQTLDQVIAKLQAGEIRAGG